MRGREINLGSEIRKLLSELAADSDLFPGLCPSASAAQYLGEGRDEFV